VIIMKITGQIAIKLIVFNALVGTLLFLIIEVLFAQIFLDLVQNNENSYYIILIFIAGFLISSLIAVISSSFTAEQIDKRATIVASMLALIANLTLWIAIAYIRLKDLVNTVQFVDKIVLMPKVLTYFAILTFPSITLVWLLAQITFSVLFGLFLYLIRAPISKKAGKPRSDWI
jgi:hypothetical protein